MHILVKQLLLWLPSAELNFIHIGGYFSNRKLLSIIVLKWVVSQDAILIHFFREHENTILD